MKGSKPRNLHLVSSGLGRKRPAYSAGVQNGGHFVATEDLLA